MTTLIDTKKTARPLRVMDASLKEAFQQQKKILGGVTNENQKEFYYLCCYHHRRPSLEAMRDLMVFLCLEEGLYIGDISYTNVRHCDPGFAVRVGAESFRRRQESQS